MWNPPGGQNSPAGVGTPVLFLSSGDLIADRRYQWAIDHLTLGDLAGAADILVQTLEIAPHFATAWFALAAIREKQGDKGAAIAAFEHTRDNDPDDYHGARLQLARLGVGEATPEMTAVYVRRLFDQHAPRFEDSLLNRLGYCAPQKLLDAVKTAAGEGARFKSMLDLGCGTGLAGVAFRPIADWIAGVDVSAAMIEQARSKGAYDRLVVGELTQFLADERDAGASYPLIVAADVFVYVHDLAPIASAVARLLPPQGLFAFTIEACAGGGLVLQQTLRYAHSEQHARSALAGAKLRTLTLEGVSTRTENGAPVPGLLVVATPA
jgi:predicted TPR repeat methyltransferase